MNALILCTQKGSTRNTFVHVLFSRTTRGWLDLRDVKTMQELSRSGAFEPMGNSPSIAAVTQIGRCLGGISLLAKRCRPYLLRDLKFGSSATLVSVLNNTTTLISLCRNSNNSRSEMSFLHLSLSKHIWIGGFHCTCPCSFVLS
jgi:hypothetical protein